MAVNYAHYRRQIAQIQALAQALVTRDYDHTDANGTTWHYVQGAGGKITHVEYVGHMGVPRPGAIMHHAQGASGGGGKPSASAKAAERIADLHKTAAEHQAAKRLPPEQPPGGKLVPVKAVDTKEIFRNGVPSAEKLAEAFGPDQLGKALYAYPTSMLNLMAQELAPKYGFDITGITKNHDALASIITAHVTHGDYSAHFGVGRTASPAERIAAMHAEAHAWQTDPDHHAPPEHRPEDGPPQPIKTVALGRFNPLKTMGDPQTAQALIEAYGEHQYGALIASQPLASLRDIARDAGVDTRGIANNYDALVSAITHHVTNGHYSAEFAKAAPAAANTKPAADPERAARLARLRDQIAALRQEHEAHLADHPVMKHLAAAQKATEAKVGGGKSKRTQPEDDLVPIRTGIKHEFDPLDPVDPVFQRQLYGDAQLRKALDRFGTTALRESAARRLGTDAPVKGSKEKAAAYRERLLSALEAFAKQQP